MTSRYRLLEANSTVANNCDKARPPPPMQGHDSVFSKYRNGLLFMTAVTVMMYGPIVSRVPDAELEAKLTYTQHSHDKRTYTYYRRHLFKFWAST